LAEGNNNAGGRRLAIIKEALDLQVTVTERALEPTVKGGCFRRNASPPLDVVGRSAERHQLQLGRSLPVALTDVREGLQGRSGHAVAPSQFVTFENRMRAS
jgi:hypothetical protein